MKKVYQRKCVSCKEQFYPRLNTQVCCSPKCAIDYVKKRDEKEATKQWKEQKKLLKENTKTLSRYEAEAKKSFQKFIRRRDAGLNCISCDLPNDFMDGGHFKKAEIYSGVIFNENNCHSQCRKCNRFLNGNELNYRQGLIKRYGLQYAEDIEQLANETRNYKYTKEQLIAIKLKYDIKLKEFK